jgi:DNA primase catalytic core
MRKKMDLNEFVDTCHACLLSGKHIVPAKYLIKDRRLSPNIIKDEKLGFCNFAIDKAFNCEYYRGEANSYRAYVKNRVIFPIRDDCGLVVGFGSREPDASVHSGWSNNRLSKESYLYGLDKARNAAFKLNKLYVVEGYADCLILRQHGLHNVVAMMGVGLTPRAMGLILRYCNRVCFCFDTDVEKEGKEGAGQKALKKISTEVDRGSLSFFDEMSAIVLPEGIDPDEYVLANSLDAFLELENPL